MQKEVYTFIEQHTQDPIVKRHTCQSSHKDFAIYQSDINFYQKISPTFDGKKFAIPLPTLSPLERQKRRLAWRNERKLYKNICGLSGDTIISFVSPDKPYPVYKRELRFSDKYNPLDYGLDFDFSQTFGEQFRKLLDTVPRYSVQQQDPIQNSGYCNCVSNCKNSYFLFDSDYCESSYYSNVLKHSDYCVDCSVVSNAQNCYQCTNSKNCFACQYCDYCVDSNYSYYCLDCIQCTECFGCANLRNARYCLFNEKYEKEEYHNKIKELLKDPELPQMIDAFMSSQVRRGTYNIQSDRSYGHNMVNTKESSFCFDVADVDACRYCDFVYGAQNCQDVSSLGENMSWVYDSVSVGIDSTRIFFSSTVVVGSSDVFYSYMCFPMVKHCFGCVGMKNNSYCIFNKQYTPDAYEKMVAKIIEHMQKTGEWGLFFSPSLSPFGYNETVAQELFPLSKEDAIEHGYNRLDTNYDPPIPAGTITLSTSDIPHIDHATEDICNQIIICSESKKPFRITKQEFIWYKKNTIAIPDLHPDIRHIQRRNRSGSRDLYIRSCDHSGTSILSIYPINHPARVYSPESYNTLVS